MKRALFLFAAVAVLASSCSAEPDAGSASSTTAASATTEATTSTTATPPTTRAPVSLPPNDGLARNQLGYVFPDPPALTVAGDLESEAQANLNLLWDSLTTTEIDTAAMGRLADSGDPRLVWLMADLMRFISGGPVLETLLSTVTALTTIDFEADPVALRSPWQSLTDHLIAWDVPAHPGYQEYKGRLFTIIEPRWQEFFADTEAEIDWRLTSWGGVRIDARPLGDQLPCPQGCIPALDDPSVTGAAGGDWYPDERIVFGVVVNGEARAYPKNQMEIHEMVNDTLGGRRLGIPYCTLCGSAQAYFTDSVPAGVGAPVLRTSGLLTRSNKVMYDLNTFSIFDTFTGEAVSGPLREQGIVLEQTTVITSTWADWKVAHPETTIVAEDGGIGRSYALDPLRGRDDAGPIFPIGDVDPRLAVQAPVIGIIAPDGQAIAFAVDDLERTLVFGESLEYNGIVVRPNGGGFEAALVDGTAVAAHQAFWFAWSQFHPDTLLWNG